MIKSSLKTKNSIEEKIRHEQEYVAFLKKRIESKNYKENVSEDELKKTRLKYDKAKLKLRMLKGDL